MEEKSKRTLSSKQKKILFSVLAVVVAICMFLAGFFIRPLFYDKATRDMIEIIRLTKENYDGEFEISDSDYGKVVTNYLLDDYSTYYTEEEYQAIMAAAAGENLGIGLSFLVSDELPVIYSVEGNSPAEKAGFKAGEMLISGSFEGEITEFDTKDEALEYLRDKKEGDEFKLTTILPDGVTEKNYTIKKQKYNKNYVKYFDDEYEYNFYKEYEDENWSAIKTTNDGEEGITGLPVNTALISFSAFEGEVEKQLKLALDIMKERGKSKLILDLRSNGGGYMDILCSIAPYFIDINNKKSIIAVAKYKKAKTENFYFSGDKFYSNVSSISVIADPNTASASECLIGAMLYYKTCFDLDKLIIQKNSTGKATTFGKGIMQANYYLKTGSVLKLTVAHVYQPDGKTCIHDVGIVPNEHNVADSATSALQKAILALS